ncbi:MAG TPA: SMP-30/gluconolactonase/LRE family protein [Gemmataceae bacterium]|nr:SMP-30/gluconolactonase/LRE family protein [Gemmataceae bacterium]
MKSTAARVFVNFEDDEDRFLPEGSRAITIGGREALIWVNIQTAVDATRGAIHGYFFDDGEQALWNLPKRPGFVLPTDKDGVVFVGMEKELGTLDLESNEFRTLTKLPDISPRTIINDGEVVPGGREVVFGTKDLKFQIDIAALYLYALSDGSLSVLAPRQTCSNGKVFTRDAAGPVLLDIDTPTRKVVRYRREVGVKSAPPDGVALDLAAEPGFPDGMCDGGDGTVIIAFYNPDPIPAGRAVRYDLASGNAIEEWTTPGSPRVTCPALVQRPDGVKLFLTTATEGMPAEQREKCPEAGNLFIADTDFKSCPAIEVVRLG